MTRIYWMWGLEVRDSKTENWNWIKVMGYVTEPGMRWTQDGDREGDRERGFGSDREEKAKFGEMVRKCQCLFASGVWTGHHDSS